MRKGSTVKVIENNLLRLGNRLLLISVLGVFGYICIKYVLSGPTKDVPLTLKGQKTPIEKAAEPIILSSVRPFPFYRDKIKQRNIFEAPWEKVKEGVDITAKAAVDISQQLRLIGIVLDQDPKAIVEDLKGKQTVFLSEGEFWGEIQLEEIRADRVIFVTHDEKVELVP